MDEDDIIAFVEDYVRRHGPTKISEIGKLLGIGRKYLREIIKSSIELSVAGWHVKLKELVDSEFGEVTPEELVLLRRYNVPTPSELEERKKFLLDQSAISHKDGNVAGETPSDMFVELTQASIELLTQLTKERTRQLALQLSSELSPRGYGREYEVYIYVCGKNKSVVKGWAAIVASGRRILYRLNGCLVKVSLPYAYMSSINRVLRFIPPNSKVRISCGNRGNSIMKRYMFRTRLRATLKDTEMRNLLLSTTALYNVEFVSNQRSNVINYCKKTALKAKQALYLKGVKNGSL